MASRLVRPIVPMSTTGQKMYEKMRKLGVNQKEFAELSGISTSYLNRIMHGKQEISDNIRAKIEVAFDLLEEDKGDSLDGDFTPPKNDWFTRKQLQEEREKGTPITPEMLVEISDVQHGRKPFVDYTKYAPAKEEPATMQALSKLFIRIATEAEIGDNIFAIYGQAVLRMIGGDE